MSNLSHPPRTLHSSTNAGIQTNLWSSPTDHRTGGTARQARVNTGFVGPVPTSEQAPDLLDHPYVRGSVPTATRAA
jgi:hypothetical protein